MRKLSVLLAVSSALVLAACSPDVQAPSGGAETNEVVQDTTDTAGEGADPSSDTSAESDQAESAESSSIEDQTDAGMSAALNEGADLGAMADLTQASYNYYLPDAISGMIAATEGYNVTVSEVSFIQTQDGPTYNVIGWNGEYHIDYFLHAESGEEEADLVENVMPLDQIDHQNIISPEDAVDIASAESGGTPVQWHLHVPEGEEYAVYDVQLQDGQVVTVHSMSAEVVG